MMFIDCGKFVNMFTTFLLPKQQRHTLKSAGYPDTPYLKSLKPLI